MILFIYNWCTVIGQIANWVASQRTTQLSVAATNHSALSIVEMRPDEIR